MEDKTGYRIVNWFGGVLAGFAVGFFPVWAYYGLPIATLVAGILCGAVLVLACAGMALMGLIYN